METIDDVVAAAERFLAAVDAAKAAQRAEEPERPLGLRGMAEEAGLPCKPLYTVPEVSKATGISAYVLWREIRAGRLKARMPVGRKRGVLIAREWFDEWMEEGIA